MPRKGRVLELLVEAIEKNLGSGEFNITSPAYLEDRVTNQKREIDVLLTQGHGRHKFLTAFECKDLNRKVGVPELEAFHTKTKDLQINKAILVSSKGFANTALKKAKFYNIICLTLSELEAIDWLQTKEVIIQEKVVTKQSWSINTTDNTVLKRNNLKVFHISGIEFCESLMQENMQMCMKTIPNEALQVGLTYAHEFSFKPEDFVIKDLSTKDSFPVSECKLNIEFLLTESKVPVKCVKYEDTTDGHVITHLGVAEIETRTIPKTNLCLIEQSDGSVEIVSTKEN
ncbi:restriction endonuclease [Vibrio parahaemolyticus]|nr:restriction endonuclease [Vibrio parahaemolyticus]EJG0800455.1 restriction endonuclease [Vibrio parahaemolyticus]